MAQHLLFKISWLATNIQPTLRFLFDNDQPIPLVRCQPLINGVEIEFQSPTSPQHRLKWGLEFPGHTLRSLRAALSVDAGLAVELASIASRRHSWSEEGTA